MCISNVAVLDHTRTFCFWLGCTKHGIRFCTLEHIPTQTLLPLCEIFTFTLIVTYSTAIQHFFHRFEDNNDLFSNRPKSMPGHDRKGPGSILENMINKDDRDWLDMATDTRPASAGNVLDRGSKPSGKSEKLGEWVMLQKSNSVHFEKLESFVVNNTKTLLRCTWSAGKSCVFCQLFSFFYLLYLY